MPAAGRRDRRARRSPRTRGRRWRVGVALAGVPGSARPRPPRRRGRTAARSWRGRLSASPRGSRRVAPPLPGARCRAARGAALGPDARPCASTPRWCLLVIWVLAWSRAGSAELRGVRLALAVWALAVLASLPVDAPDARLAPRQLGRPRAGGAAAGVLALWRSARPSVARRRRRTISTGQFAWWMHLPRDRADQRVVQPSTCRASP